MSLINLLTKYDKDQRIDQTKRRLTNLIRRSFLRIKDARTLSYSRVKFDRELERVIPAGLSLDLRQEDIQAITYNLSHKFNLLGSGWITIKYNMECIGFEGIKYSSQPLKTEDNRFRELVNRVSGPNKQIAQQIRRLISEEYIPIDWHIDFKSGYRWSERTWYRDIRYGNVEGADVKLPWELSRMQHLIDFGALFLNNGNVHLKTEFCDQILDWIAANPPRFGVNWACTMDVAIRAANWVIAYDLFCSAGVEFEQSFKEVFFASLYDHGTHIVQNLEWSEYHRSNHYLSNITGLLILSIYLPCSKQANAWLAFAIQELELETNRQFLDDGSNFEASTSYHRLCSEMIAVCALFLEGLPKSKLSALRKVNHKDMSYKPALKSDTIWNIMDQYDRNGRLMSDHFYKKVFLAARFTKDLTKHDGTVPQIGDNDSGRFIRIGGWRQKRLLNEFPHSGVATDEINTLEQEHLNHQQSTVWAHVLFNMENDVPLSESVVMKFAESIAASRRKSQPLSCLNQQSPTAATHHSVNFEKLIAGFTPKQVVSSFYESGPDLFKDAEYKSYPNFGVYIVKSNHIHLTIRCGSAINDSCGIHAHEDQLSFDLMIDGRNIAVDPGTFVYSPSKEKRNQYRSAEAHCSPSIPKIVGDPVKGVFSSPNVRKGEPLYFGRAGFIGSIEVQGCKIIRKFIFRDNGIEIQDYYDIEDPVKPELTDLFKPELTLPFSPGYGMVCL